MYSVLSVRSAPPLTAVPLPYISFRWQNMITSEGSVDYRDVYMQVVPGHNQLPVLYPGWFRLCVERRDAFNVAFKKLCS